MFKGLFNPFSTTETVSKTVTREYDKDGKVAKETVTITTGGDARHPGEEEIEDIFAGMDDFFNTMNEAFSKLGKRRRKS